MTYSGPVGIIGCDVGLLGKPEDALLEDQLGLGSSHRWPHKMVTAVNTCRASILSTWRKELEPAPSVAVSGTAADKGGSPAARSLGERAGNVPSKVWPGFQVELPV
jgi:hypothetical protein